jgi:hypothetical protein
VWLASVSWWWLMLTTAYLELQGLKLFVMRENNSLFARLLSVGFLSLLWKD